MSYLNEDEADAFFHQGDAGTYDGGPALSLAPVGMADLIEEVDAPRPPSAEQVARRARLKRLVTTVVSTLGIGSVLVFALRITRQDSATASAASLTVRETGHASRAVLPAEPAPPAPAFVPEAAPAPPAVPSPAPEATVVTAPAAEPPAAPPSLHAAQVAAPAPAAPPVVRVSSNRPPTAERVQARSGHVSPAHTALVKAMAANSVGSRHAPPTATFPD